MNMRPLLGKVLKAGLLVTCFLLLLAVTYIVYIILFAVDVVFYASLLSVAIATILFASATWFSRLGLGFEAFEKLQLVAICGLVGYCLAISVPTVIDRSLSFYILEKLRQRGGGIRLESFETVFREEYMREHHLVEVRLTEQVQSGTITIDGNCVRLTGFGYSLASMSMWFRRNLLPKRRLLGNRYTDELTDPFARSARYLDYRC